MQAPIKKEPIKKVFDRPQPKVMKAPSGKLSTSSLSIKKMIAPKQLDEDGKAIDLTNMPMRDYDMDDFKMAWRRFAHILKDRGEKTFYNALLKRDPIVKPDNVFVLELDNQAQLDVINIKISELLDYLRGELKNYSIQIELTITTEQENDVKFQTGKDKFAALARKNPNLHALKKMFNLDIEF